jgi:hypothetical protein
MIKNSAIPKIITIIIIWTITSSLTYCQGLTWGDIVGCDYSKISVEPNQIIDCQNFFDLADSCYINALITWNWTTFPKVENLDSVIDKLQYPISAKPYKISGKVFIRCLIDKTGNIYCYKILTELGESFVVEVEKIVSLFKFSKASISEKPIGYQYTIPITFKYEPPDLKKNRIKRHN